jgi:hypothetical protein
VIPHTRLVGALLLLIVVGLLGLKVPLAAFGEEQSEPGWWDPGYLTRMRITVAGGPSGALAGEVVALPRGPGNGARRDWRLLWWTGLAWREVPRVATGDRTWFRLVEGIAPNLSDNRYWLYSNNPTESSEPPIEGVLRFFDDFESDLGQWQAVPATARAGLAGGLLRLQAPAPDGEPNNYMISQQRFGPGTMAEIKVRSVSYTGDGNGRYGRDVDVGFATRPLDGDARWRLENLSVWQTLIDPGTGYGAAPRSNISGAPRWRLFQIARYPAPDGRVIFALDDGPTEAVHAPPLTPQGELALMLRTYDSISGSGPAALGVQAEIDWVAVFDVPARLPPSVQVGPTQGAGGQLQLSLALPPADSIGSASASISLWPAAVPTDLGPFQRWHLNLAPDNSVTLSDLPPGDYTLELALRYGHCIPISTTVLTNTLSTLADVVALDGDLNGDGFATVRDQTLLATAFPASIHTQGYNALADLTRDGRVDEADMDYFARSWRQGRPCR